jgi:hypothetical protein
MIEWILTHGEIIVVSAFWFCTVVCLILLSWGVYRRSRKMLILGCALLLPIAFFGALLPWLGGIDELQFWIAAVTIWSSILLSVVLAVWGIWRRSSVTVLASAITALPFSYYFFLSPGGRAALLVPLILAIIAMALEWIPGLNRTI